MCDHRVQQTGLVSAASSIFPDHDLWQMRDVLVVILPFIYKSKNDKIELDGEEIDEVEDFVYLKSKISWDGGSDRDIQVRVGKARTAFTILTPVWKSKVISRKTKLRIFNTNVKSVLLYGCKTWRVTKETFKKLQSFVNRCLRSIMAIHWPEVIRNEELWTRAEQERINIQIRRRKWSWIGHTLRKPNYNVTKQALRWNP